MKFGIVDLKGGLGNQIFQLAFALYLKSLGIKVCVDSHFYYLENTFPRDLEVEPKLFNLKKINFKNNRIFFLLNSYFLENNTFDINDFRIVNRFVGYYQDLQYLEFSKEVLRKKLNLDYGNLNNNIAIHIRKTDYKTINQELNLDYYKAAIDNCLQVSKNARFDIFTDAKKLELNPKIFRNIDNIFYPKQNEAPLNVLKKLTGYRSFIIANSSFSAIAAFLSTSNSKKVFYPDPWFRNSEIQLKSIPSNWIPISNSDSQ